MSKGMGFIGRVNYSYKGKYLFSASSRYEADSRLSKDNRWNLFPAVSVGWRISDEAFMAGTKSWLDNLKLPELLPVLLNTVLWHLWKM